MGRCGRLWPGGFGTGALDHGPWSKLTTFYADLHLKALQRMLTLILGCLHFFIKKPCMTSGYYCLCILWLYSVTFITDYIILLDQITITHFMLELCKNNSALWSLSTKRMQQQKSFPLIKWEISRLKWSGLHRCSVLIDTFWKMCIPAHILQLQKTKTLYFWFLELLLILNVLHYCLHWFYFK